MHCEVKAVPTQACHLPAFSQSLTREPQGRLTSKQSRCAGECPGPFLPPLQHRGPTMVLRCRASLRAQQHGGGGHADLCLVWIAVTRGT